MKHFEVARAQAIVLWLAEAQHRSPVDRDACRVGRYLCAITKGRISMRSMFLGFPVACLLASSACTTLQPTLALPVSNLESASIGSGDRIEVTTVSGQRIAFVVGELTGAGISGAMKSGESVMIEYENIAALSVRRFSAGKTAGLAAGAAAAALLIFAVEDAAFFPGGPAY
jgi:hypothetical protein